MLELCFAVTMHLGLSGDLNDLHPCIRYVEDDFTIGAYVNSHSEPSYYVSYTIGDEWFAEVGVVTGYYDGLAPMIRGGYRVSDNIAVFASPTYRLKSMESGVVVGVEYSFSIDGGRD